MQQKYKWLFSSKWNWFRIRLNVVIKKAHLKFKFRPCYGKKKLSLEEAQDKIRQIILKGEPALVARFGSNEATCTVSTIGIKLGAIKKFKESLLYRMNNNAGLFPYGEKMALRFGEISVDAAKQVDLLGVWDSTMQDYLVKNVCSKKMQITMLKNLEPYYSETNPWTAALKGKKVLVIHPFKETIEAQYKKRELLFENPNMLPEFDLTVIKAVQTIAGESDSRFMDWEDALNYMHNQAMKVDFDVAIIGCGAYGMPLAAKLKQSGKIAIHLGGATQLLFGIKGARWDNQPLSRLYNEHWVRPQQTERPKAANGVEGACYW